jgi:mRNA interferase RelE/StbE
VNDFELVLTVEAQESIRRLSKPIRERVLDKLDWMASNAALLVHQPLKGMQWGGAYRYRMGDYRIIYLLDIEQSRLTVLNIGHRREIYKR